MSLPHLEVPDWIRDALNAGDKNDPELAKILEVAAELEFRRCAADWKYFLRTYWQIQFHNTAQVGPFPITTEQEDLLEAFFSETSLVCLKARQIGFSTCISAASFWEVFFHPHWTTLFLSRKEDDAKELLAKARLGFDSLPQWMRDRGPKRTTNNSTELRFDNGSVIESLPSKDNPARSRSARRVVADEYAFFEDQVASFASFKPTIDNGAYLVLMSTANGLGDEFERIIKGARAGDRNGGWPLKDKTLPANNFAFRFYSWRARKDRDDTWYERQRADYLPHKLAQEFPSDPDEAFLLSGNLVFDPEVVGEWESHPGTKGELVDGDFIPHFDGELTIWREPLKGAAYVIGADVAEGHDWGDWSVAHVIRVATGEHVATLRTHREVDHYAEALAALGQFYNWAILGVEANNHGKATLLVLKQIRYPKLYYRWLYDRRKKTRTEQLGWFTTEQSKATMITTLWRAMRNGACTTQDEHLKGEMLTYRRFMSKDGKMVRMGGQPHDDHVMAHALAVMMLQHAGVDYLPEEEQEPIDPNEIAFETANTWAEWARQADQHAYRMQQVRKKTLWPTTAIPARIPSASRASSSLSGSAASMPRRPSRTGR